MKRFVKLAAIFVTLLLLDIISKNLVVKHISKMDWMDFFYPFGGIGVFKDFFGITFSIVRVENTGAAWGLFHRWPNLLFYIRVIIVIGLIFYLIFNKNKIKDFPLTLIVTGAIGNIIDFIFYKKVIDMFYFIFGGYSYPVFNLADAMITIGIVWLFITFFLKQKKFKRC